MTKQICTITPKNKLWDNCFYLCNSIRVKDIFSLTKVNQVKLVGKQALRSSCELLRQLLKWKQGHGIACKPLELHVSLWNWMQAHVTACNVMELLGTAFLCLSGFIHHFVLCALWTLKFKSLRFKICIYQRKGFNGKCTVY